MPSTTHEALLMLIRDNLSLLGERRSESFQQVMSSLAGAVVVSGDATETTPVERRADLVVLCKGENGENTLAIIVEVQLSEDPRKLATWLVYLTGVHARYRCPTLLMVVTTSPEVAAWCARPIETGHPGFVLEPLVLGPKQVPVVRDVEEVLARPEMAVLSALMHGKSDAGGAIARSFLGAAHGLVDKLGEDRATQYLDLVLLSLNEETKRTLEVDVKGGYEPQSELLRMVKAQGDAEGSLRTAAEAVLKVLGARGIVVPEDVRARVLGSEDSVELDGWLCRAAVVGDARELFTAT
ncbi:hypothetical protein [Chondromyces apiculatus]|nr:hypothetical protein [Chondromyces apiculatus]